MIEVLSMAAAIALQAEPKEKEGLPLETSRRIEFTTNEATWLSLDVAPDGRSLMLEIAGDLYTLPIEGGEARAVLTGLPFESQPRFSPDGKWIAFLSDRSGAENVWIARPDGAEAKKLSDDKDSEFASPAWSADGRYVIAARTNWGQSTYELWMYHVDGGAGVQLTKAKPEPKTLGTSGQTRSGPWPRPTAGISTTLARTAASNTTRPSPCGKSREWT